MFLARTRTRKLDETMTISSSSSANWNGLKEFANGDAALFNGNQLIDEIVDVEKDSRDEFEDEFHRLLTESSSFQIDSSIINNLSSFNSNTDDFYPTPPDIMRFEATIQHDVADNNVVKFEEDPLSAILNTEQIQMPQARSKKRGRPPLIKFKPTAEYIISKPVSSKVNSSSTPQFSNVPLLAQQNLELRERRSSDDCYSPVWIRGRGVDREGLCPLCDPPHWFKIKQSAYWYHMNFYHGISAATGKPYKRPINYRLTANGISSALASSNKVEGHCGNCLQWILLATEFKGSDQSDLEENVSFSAWYKHAQKCHYRTKEFIIPF